MAKFKHTERTRKIYNSIIKEYREISSDSDLVALGIDYNDYRSSELGLLLDSMRLNGEGMTSSKRVAEWMKRHSCNVYRIADNWKVQL